LGDIVFQHTPMGSLILNSPTARIRSELRRMLELLDGRRTVDAVANAFRVGDALRLTGELFNAGWIETTTGAHAAITASRAMGARAPLTVAQFEAAQHAAADAARELLGATARPLVLEIKACRDSAMLRAAVDSVGDRLSRVLGKDALTIFVDSVRSAARTA
jgi:hypothetical protein